MPATQPRPAFAKVLRRDLPEGSRCTGLYSDASLRSHLQTLAREVNEGEVIDHGGKPHVVTWGDEVSVQVQKVAA